MQLWSGLLSPFSGKIRIYMRERAIPFDCHEVPWSKTSLWGPKPEAFLAASPRGEVPALIDGSVSVFDSTLIWQYLEEAYPEQPLFPTDLADRAACRAWEELADHAMAQHLTTLIREGFMKPDGSGDQTALAGALNAMQTYYQQLDQHLGASDYLCPGYSIADIATFMCLGFAQTLGAGFDNHPNLQAWFERMLARPIVAEEYEAILQGAVSVS